MGDVPRGDRLALFDTGMEELSGQGYSILVQFGRIFGGNWVDLAGYHGLEARGDFVNGRADGVRLQFLY